MKKKPFKKNPVREKGILDMTNPKSLFLLDEFFKLNRKQRQELYLDSEKRKYYSNLLKKKWKEHCRLNEKEERS